MEQMSLALLFCLLTCVTGFSKHTPDPTNAAQDVPDPLGWTPKPTTPPMNGYLAKRDSGQLCGWIDGVLNNPYSCISNAGCGYLQGNTDHQPLFGCCWTTAVESTLSGGGIVYNPEDCNYVYTCLDYTQISNSSCTTGTSVRMCSDSQLPFCQSFVYGRPDRPFEYGYKSWGCDSTRSTIEQTYVYANWTASETQPTPSNTPVSTAQSGTCLGSDARVSSQCFTTYPFTYLTQECYQPYTSTTAPFATTVNATSLYQTPTMGSLPGTGTGPSFSSATSDACNRGSLNGMMLVILSAAVIGLGTFL